MTSALPSTITGDNRRMRTALTILAERLSLSQAAINVAAAMLRSTPVAIVPEETLVPRADLAAAAAADSGSPQSVISIAMDELMEMRKLPAAPGGPTRTLSVLSGFTWVRESTFLRFQFNPAFVAMLKNIALREDVAPF